MAAQPQETQVLSVRISAALRTRLEKLREFTSRRTSEKVSTSDVAKQLLETARGDRLEFFELLREPTETLLQIRKKCEAQHSLSRVEWSVLAHYVQQGQEAFSLNRLSRESEIAVLEAFQSVYKLRQGSSDRDHYYAGNLPCQPHRSPANADKDPAGIDIVRQAVSATLKALNDPADKVEGSFAGRNLQVFLDEEKISGIEALNQALRPHWPALWRVGARGHYLEKRQPIRENVKKDEYLYGPPLPDFSEGGYKLSLNRNERGDLYLLLNFPGPRGPMYPMTQYAVISEFRAMLIGLTAKSLWDGKHFYGYAVQRDKESDFWFRSQENGIMFGFSEQEWAAVRKLFRRAWEKPEVQTVWEALTLEYGEL